MGKEEIELAEEHIDLAEDLVLKEARDEETSEDNSEKKAKKGKLLKRAAFDLERAKSEVEEADGKENKKVKKKK
jgi:hypothetical protein